MPFVVLGLFQRFLSRASSASMSTDPQHVGPSFILLVCHYFSFVRCLCPAPATRKKVSRKRGRGQMLLQAWCILNKPQKFMSSSTARLNPPGPFSLPSPVRCCPQPVWPPALLRRGELPLQAPEALVDVLVDALHGGSARDSMGQVGRPPSWTPERRGTGPKFRWVRAGLPKKKTTTTHS